jgi:hypothetical protein
MAQIFVFIISLLIFSLPQHVFAATTVTSFTPGAATVGLYQKYEATFSISRTFPVMPDFAYPNLFDQAKQSMLPYYYYDPADNPTAYPGRTSPYGIDGITINANIISPSGRQITLPAFYYQQFSRSGDVMTPSSSYSWKFRYAPDETGTYTYTISIQDKNGASTYPASGNLSFQSSTSAKSGFVRVSATDPRYYEFTSGASFIPLGSGRQWYTANSRVTGYESTFANWKTNGINFTRIWDQNDGFGLTTEGHFDKSSSTNWWDNYPPTDNYNAGRGDKYNPDNLAKGTQINQRGAFEKDLIVTSADNNNVYLQLCSHGDPYWIWDASIYDESWNHSVRTFADPEHLNYWKRNYRYRIARYGYSTSVFAWETWNEHGHIMAGTDLYNFYQTLGQYINSTDPYHHLRTTSQGSQAFSPGFWSSGGMDLANFHDYLRPSSSYRNVEAQFVYRTAWCVVNNYGCSGMGLGDTSNWTGAKKPWVWGEIDVTSSDPAKLWTDPDPAIIDGDARIRMLHNTTWAGLFSPMGVSPLDWYWDRQTQSQTDTDRFADRKATSQFFTGLDLAHANFTHLMTAADVPTGYAGETIGSDNDTARVYAMRRADKKAAYLWVQNRNFTWFTSPAVTTAITPKITVNNLLSESYKVEIWNTHTGTGQIISTQTLTPVSGSLTLLMPAFSNDLAVKIESTGGIITPTVTPSPTPVTPKPGDANGDGIINFTDMVKWLNGYLGSFTETPNGDFDGSGKIDGKDYFIWLQNYGK